MPFAKRLLKSPPSCAAVGVVHKFCAFERNQDFPAIYEKEKPQQITDTGAIEKMIDEVIAANPKQLEQYRAGKKTVAGFFVGQIMKASKGQANPALVNELLTKKLDG